MRRFDGKVAFVTGSAAGIGRATALRLASEGASLYLIDLALEGLQETAKRCEELGAAVAHARCDVTREAEVRANVQACVDRFGRLDAHRARPAAPQADRDDGGRLRDGRLRR